MKLFAKYNRITLASVVLIFLIAGVAFSFLIRYVVIKGIDEDLRIEKNEILSYVTQYRSLPPVVEVHDQSTSYIQVAKFTDIKNHIYSKRIHNRQDEEEEWVRFIKFGVAAGGNNYLVTVSKSLRGTDDLITTIILITTGTILLILVVTFFINRLLLRRLWQPFYDTLQATKSFQLSNANVPHFSNSGIEEFDLLNTTLVQTISKAQHDYRVLKEFTEDASHEMQTPLAVLRSKLDVMIQSEDLTEKQSRAVSGAYEAIRSLKKLNQSLLLLAKIENRQFRETVQLDLQQMIQNKHNQFCEQWQGEDLRVQLQTEAATICGNPQLMDVLLNNLFSNATKHNYKGGCMAIVLQPSKLTISNSGAARALEERQIFNRFYKGDSATGSHGLGLAIVKEICETSGYQYGYFFAPPDVHCFTIEW